MKRWSIVLTLVLVFVGVFPTMPGVLPLGATVTPPTMLDAKLLVVSADGSEPILALIQQTLDYLGTPYDVWIAASRPGQLTADKLAAGRHSFYQGLVLTTGDLGYSPDGQTWVSALSSTEWQTLAAWQASFSLRQVTWYTFPTAAYGFGTPTVIDTAVAPLTVRLTPAGQTIFSYLNTANPVTIKMAYTFLAPATDPAATPLMLDSSGNALAAVMTYPDGRQNLALTFDGNRNLTHSITLAYGLVNWVTKGVFIGERHVYLSAQVDDIFISDDLFVGGEYRMTGADLQAVLAWQALQRAQAVTRNLVLHFAYNAEGMTGFAPDTLTPALKAANKSFQWISHTFSHTNLDAIDYAGATTELARNGSASWSIGLDRTVFSFHTLVTPDISGLSNPAFLQAAKDYGIWYVVSDTSRPGMGNPSPNTGIFNVLQPAIFEIPRYPVNLFYNVSTPDEWVAEYNFLYHDYWGRDLTYDEILGNVSETLLSYLLKGDMNPWMFHQSNLRAYDGTHTLLGDLLDRTLTKYTALYSIPIVSPPMETLGLRMKNQTNYKGAGVSAVIQPGVSIRISSAQPAMVPLTGVKRPVAELYAGQWVSLVNVTPRQAITLPLH